MCKLKKESTMSHSIDSGFFLMKIIYDEEKVEKKMHFIVSKLSTAIRYVS